MDDSGEQRVEDLALQSDADHRRTDALVREHMNFAWRSLRRLGVGESECDDGCQRVWLVVARRVHSIQSGRERSFIFSVIVRVASEMRRAAARRHWEVLDDLDQEATGQGDPEGYCERQRALRLLDDQLGSMNWDCRLVFVMYEIEGFSTPEIAEILKVSRGTIASRLRLAREAFQRGLERHRMRSSGIRLIAADDKLQARAN